MLGEMWPGTDWEQSESSSSASSSEETPRELPADVYRRVGPSTREDVVDVPISTPTPSQ
jgi:hypothetical protein